MEDEHDAVVAQVWCCTVGGARDNVSMLDRGSPGASKTLGSATGNPLLPSLLVNLTLFMKSMKQAMPLSLPTKGARSRLNGSSRRRESLSATAESCGMATC